MNYTSYDTKTIAETIARLNKDYFIPAIQRPYVWEVEQIEKLFDSLMKEYPISTFLLWNPPVENKNNWHTYRFAQDFKYGEIHNEEADLSSVPEIHLVLDGQQRLTSILIGLAGSYRVRPKYKRKHIESSYIKQELYLNLLKDSENTGDTDEEVEGVTYGFSFINPEKLSRRDDEFWFRVGDILSVSNLDMFEDLLDSITEKMESIEIHADKKRIARRNLKRLHSVIWEHRSISSCIVKQSSYDKVLDIFVRANSGGETLSKSDLLMSLVTLNWTNFNARNELVDFINEINTELSTQNNYDRDFILRSALLFCDQKYVFRVDSFTKETLAQIEANWVIIKKALRRAVELVNSFGISNSKGNLTSNNSLMPIAYYIFQLYKKHEASDQNVEMILIRNQRRIRVWLVTSLFAGVFAGAADSTVSKATRIIRDNIDQSNDFPALQIVENLTHRRKNALFDTERVEDFLCLSAKDRIYRICLQMLYVQDNWEQDSKAREYIFQPSGVALDNPSNDDLIEDAHCIANMVILDEDELEEFKLLGSEEWLATRNIEQRTRHFLPSYTDCEFDDFGSFISARKEMIRPILKNIIFTHEHEDDLLNCN